MANPDLLQPQSTVQQSVPSLSKFRTVNEFGQVVQSTPAQPTTKATEMKYYYSSSPNTNFIREDGKKLSFIDSFYETELLYDQIYLDAEIADGNPYVRVATADEIEAAHFKRDPRGTIREQVRQELLNDPDVRAQLEAEIRRSLADELKIQGVDGVKREVRVEGDGVSLSGVTTAAAASPQPKLGAVSTADLSGLLVQSNKA